MVPGGAEPAPPFAASRRRRSIYERGGPGLKPEALRAQRTGIGHPEGYQEAFAVLYADAAEAIVARKLGKQPDRLALDFPTVEDGAYTMKFITAALEFVGNRRLGRLRASSNGMSFRAREAQWSPRTRPR